MKTTLWMGTLLLAAAAAAGAQDKEEAAKPGRSLTPLKVQLVVTRQEGEKKLSSLPYSFMVTAGEPGNFPMVTAGETGNTRLRMGIEVPVATGKEPGFQYRKVGTNIDCRAETLDGGRFKLRLVLEQSSVYEAGGEPTAARRSDLPLFRSFNSDFYVVLRDGQSVDYTTATDPVSGEVLKVNVTLTVAK